jgi:hypothetical protein
VFSATRWFPAGDNPIAGGPRLHYKEAARARAQGNGMKKLLTLLFTAMVALTLLAPAAQAKTHHRKHHKKHRHHHKSTQKL